MTRSLRLALPSLRRPGSCSGWRAGRMGTSDAASRMPLCLASAAGHTGSVLRTTAGGLWSAGRRAFFRDRLPLLRRRPP